MSTITEANDIVLPNNGSTAAGVDDKISALISALSSLSPTRWVDVAFIIAERSSSLDAFISAARYNYSKLGSIQAVLDHKAVPEVGNKPKIVQFIEGLLERKLKVNCLGNALAAYLIGIANEVPCEMHSSETHTWVLSRPSEGCQVIVDAKDNLKIAGRSPRPLSIYAGDKVLDDFSVCMLVIINENELEDAQLFEILHYYRDRLRHTWEISKYVSVGCSEGKSCVSVSLLYNEPESLEFAFQRAYFYMCEEEDPDEATRQLDLVLRISEKLCTGYIVNSDLWLHEDGLLKLAEEFSKIFRNRIEFDGFYEGWVSAAAELASVHMSRDVAHKFRKSAPTFSGKRRRGS
jgi:hypothetical protein